MHNNSLFYNLNYITTNSLPSSPLPHGIRKLQIQDLDGLLCLPLNVVVMVSIGPDDCTEFLCCSMLASCQALRSLPAGRHVIQKYSKNNIGN